jgi:hypothetical protein
MAIELMMVISMAMASEVVIIVFLSLAVGWGVKKNEFLKIRLKGRKKNEFFLRCVKKLNCCFLKWSWFDWKSRHHGYLETKATLKVRKAVGFKIMILFSFFEIRPTRKSHYLKNINLHYFSRSCSFRMEKQTEAFFQLSCSFPPADKVEERGLAVASIISLFGISYTK